VLAANNAVITFFTGLLLLINRVIDPAHRYSGGGIIDEHMARAKRRRYY
jgi:hypothetical protein